MSLEADTVGPSEALSTRSIAMATPSETRDGHEARDVSPVRSQLEIALLRKATEDEIRAHLDAVVKLNARLNTFSLCARLPPEILAEIFMMHVIECYQPPKRRRFGPPEPFPFPTFPHDPSPSKWIAVAQVCRHWRTVALECPMLWAFISSRTHRFWISESLARSKRAPLFFDATHSPLLRRFIILDNVDQVFREMSRIQELKVDVNVALQMPEESIIDQPAPLLRKLVITSPRNCVVGSVPLLSHLVYGNTCPSLQHLELYSTLLKLRPTFRHPNMRHLILSNRHAYIQMGRAGDLFTTLKAMPLLETLEIEHCLPKDIHVLAPGKRTIALPHLRRIRLADRTLDCAKLLTHFQIPSEAAISLWGALPSNLDFLDYCVAKIDKAVDLESLFMCLYVTQDVRFILGKLSEDKTRKEWSFGWEKLAILIRPEPNNMPMDAFVAMCKKLPLSEVRNACIESIEGVSKEDFREAFGHMRNLRVLRWRDLPLVPLADALIPENHDDAPHKLLFPQLQKLDMTQVDFRHWREFDKLRDCVIERYECGAEIQTIRLHDCVNLDSVMVELLEEIVVDVDWDYIEGWEDTDCTEESAIDEEDRDTEDLDTGEEDTDTEEDTDDSVGFIN